MTIFNRQIEKAPKVLEALVSAPSTGPGNGAFYTKDVGGIIEGFYVDSNGVEVQITTNGELNLGAVGEINTASVVGAGEDIFKEKSGTDLVFRSIRGDGSTIAVSTVGDDIVISAPIIGEDNQAANLPGGTGIFAQKNGEVLEFKSLIAGTNITLTPEANTITIDASAAGEANSGTNVGTGNEIFKEKSGTNLVFRSLTAGSGIVLTNSIDGNEIEIAATGGGGGSAITVRDEGSIIDTGLTELNFTGAGVTASQTSPGVVEVAITSGGGGGTDESVKVTANDTTAGYLLGKLVAGTNITLTENNDGENETLTISASGGGGSLAVEDDGSEILAVASRLNFTGAGVTVTDAGAGEATINIPGGGGGGGLGSEFLIKLPAAATIADRIANAGVGDIPAGLTLYQGDNGSVDANLSAGANDLVIQHSTSGLPMVVTVFALAGPFNLIYKRLDFPTVSANARSISNQGKTQFKIPSLDGEAADADALEIYVKLV